MNIYIYQLEECSCGAWKSASQWHELWHDSRVRTIIRSHSDVVWRNFVPNHFQITDTHNKNVLLFLSVGEGLFFHSHFIGVNCLAELILVFITTHTQLTSKYCYSIISCVLWKYLLFSYRAM